jgi:hypothetical protein
MTRVYPSAGVSRRLHADNAAGAGPVFDKELLAEALTEILCHEPHGYIGDAAGTVGHNDAHRS